MWYAETFEEVSNRLAVDPARGLAEAEVQQRLQQYGPNVLAAGKKETGLQAFVRQYQDLMQVILLVAAAVSFIVTRELGTTLVLVGLTIFNAVLGLRGESKAEASLAALAKTMKDIARVRRDGQAIEIEAGNLVPGDVVLVEAGNRVPADGRLFVAATLEIEEAALTGESVASPKSPDVIEEQDVPLGDRHNMVFMNTSVTRGRGEFIVTATGMETEMGGIADLLNKTEADKTPLQKQLDQLTKIIAGIAGIAFLLMIFLGVRNGQPFNDIFIAGVALAISAIPTGLPAVVTTMYSMGTRKLAEMNAIVKRLPSVETLGSVSAICSDKTGTLTLNKMTAREFVVPGRNRFTVTGEGYATQGSLTLADGSDQDRWNNEANYMKPSFDQTGDHPVVCVSDSDVAEFIAWLKQKSGKPYRLPTEAGWENACRAGTTGPRYGPLDEVAWHRGNSDGRSHPVGGRRPNAWGLHDMLGNVWEWCWDVYDAEVYGSYRVLRGGGWFDEPWSCRASVRRHGRTGSGSMGTAWSFTCRCRTLRCRSCTTCW